MTIEQLKAQVKWWESRRWIYTILVGLCVALTVYSEVRNIFKIETEVSPIGVFIWLFGANLFYSLGFLLEVCDWFYLNNRLGIVNLRLLLFILGTFFGCFWTLVMDSSLYVVAV